MSYEELSVIFRVIKRIKSWRSPIFSSNEKSDEFFSSVISKCLDAIAAMSPPFAYNHPNAEFCTLFGMALSERAGYFGSTNWLGCFESRINHYVTRCTNNHVRSMWKTRTPKNVAEMLRVLIFEALQSSQPL